MLNKSAFPFPRPKRRAAPPPERELVIQGEYITLGQLLKAADILQSGGEAKLYLVEVPVLVNGEQEQRRGRKLRPGDLVVTPDAPPVRLVAPPPAVVPPPAPVAPSALPPRVKSKPGGDLRRVAPQETPRDV